MVRGYAECRKESDDPNEVFAGLCRKCLEKKTQRRDHRIREVKKDLKDLGVGVIVPREEWSREKPKPRKIKELDPHLLLRGRLCLLG